MKPYAARSRALQSFTQPLKNPVQPFLALLRELYSPLKARRQPQPLKGFYIALRSSSKGTIPINGLSNNLFLKHQVLDMLTTKDAYGLQNVNVYIYIYIPFKFESIFLHAMFVSRPSCLGKAYPIKVLFNPVVGLHSLTEPGKGSIGPCNPMNQMKKDGGPQPMQI